MSHAGPAPLPVPPWTLAIASMTSVQLGLALSLPLIDKIGSAGTAWLRLSVGALVFLLLARPPLRQLQRRDVPAVIGLGVATGLLTASFLAAIERIPLGTAVAIEFLGPLTVAAVRSHSRRALVWPVLALTGVVLLTEPWTGDVNLAGVAFAALAALGWGTYIVLMQWMGDRFSGTSGLSMTVPIAALTTAVVGIPQAAGNLTIEVVLVAAGLALLLPVLPFALELLALRHMNPNAFGTLMALEPAIGVILGLVVLSQVPSGAQVVGIALVVTAGALAQLDAGRRPRGQPLPGDTASAGGSPQRSHPSADKLGP